MEELLDRINRLPANERQQKLVEGARKEGELVWYSTMNRKNSQELINLFEKEHPISTVSFSGLFTSGSKRSECRCWFTVWTAVHCLEWDASRASTSMCAWDFLSRFSWPFPLLFSAAFSIAFRASGLVSSK